MKMRSLASLLAVGLATVLIHTNVSGQAVDTPQKHMDAAKAAAGQSWASMYETLCVQALGRIGAPPATPNPPAASPPERSTYHAEPLKVFDNLYWLGTKEHSAWALVTSDGIILMDAIFDYNIQDE